MNTKKYQEHLQKKEKDIENICKRCGECCGALDDPCLNLKKKEDNMYYCTDYKNRLTLQKTVSGKSFTCVSIREHILNKTLRYNCAYRLK